MVARKYGFSSWRQLKSYFSKQASTENIDPSEDAVRQRRYEQLRPRNEVPIDLKLLDLYDGHYRLTPFLILSITRVGDHLVARLTGQQSIRLYPESAATFFFKDIPGAGTIPGQISFVLHGSGKAEQLILHQNGYQQTAKRTGDEAASAAAEQLARRLNENTPTPGSEAALRRVIEAALRGRPDYRQMTKALARIAAPQSPLVQKELSALGVFKRLVFKGLDRSGTDVFEAIFTGGTTEWRIFLGADRKIHGLFYRPLP